MTTDVSSPRLGAEPTVFGLRFSRDDAVTIAHKLQRFRNRSDGIGLVVTPNLDHIVNLRHNTTFAKAYHSAAIVACDGFPVHYYARLRGIPVQRATGCDIVQAVMTDPDITHRIFFVVDSSQTVTAVKRWGADRHVSIETAVPPFGFENDTAFSQRLAERIQEHRTTMLIIGMGAPKSESWVYRYKDDLPPCWALCVGQAVRIALGLTRRAPPLLRRLHGEWLWRLCQEPRRLAGRYTWGAGIFLLAVAEEWLDSRLQRLAWRDRTSAWPMIEDSGHLESFAHTSLREVA